MKTRVRGARFRLVSIAVLAAMGAALAGPPGKMEKGSWRCEDYTVPGAALPVQAPAGNPRLRTVGSAAGFRLTDDGTHQGDLLVCSKPWCADPVSGAVCRAEVKVVHCEGLAGVMIGFSDGIHEDLLTLYEDRIELYRAGLKHPMRTADGFHTYEISIRGKDVFVKADGVRVIDGSGRFTYPAHQGRNRFSFGGGASGSRGEAVWRRVCWTDGLESLRRRFPVVAGAEHSIVFKQKGIYAPFPSLRMTADRQVLYALFSKKTKRTHHETLTATPGRYCSTDGGRTWSPVEKVPAGLVGPRPPEIFSMEDGSLARIGQNWRRWFPPEKRKEFAGKYRITTPGTYKPGWIAINSGGFVARSEDGGTTWSKTAIPELDTYVSCSSPWSTLRLRDGRIMRAFMVRQSEKDSGDVWMVFTADGKQAEAVRVMGDPEEKLRFTEESLVYETKAGTIWVLTRVDGGDDHLWQGISRDGGKTWSKRKTGIVGHPPSGLVVLRDGRLVLTYGYRHPPYGIRAVVSTDEGLTWDTDNTIVLRNDGAGFDLGYPRSTQLPDGTLLTLYYFTGEDRITHVACTHWHLPQ